MAKQLRPKHTLLNMDERTVYFAPKLPSYDRINKVAIDLIDVYFMLNDAGEIVPLNYPVYYATDKETVVSYIETQFVESEFKKKKANS